MITLLIRIPPSLSCTVSGSTEDWWTDRFTIPSSVISRGSPWPVVMNTQGSRVILRYTTTIADYSTNEPTMDGTACFTYYLSAMQAEARDHTPTDYALTHDQDAVVRGDTRQPRISLVFTGHDRAEGFETVRKALRTYGIRASFFLTGDFYRNKSFSRMIKTLHQEGHYLGGHSDKHLLYCSWNNRDSLLVNKQTFVEDLKDNYAAMAAFGIRPEQAPYFLPPYEWYNDSIAVWCRQYGLQMVNFTPGTA